MRHHCFYDPESGKTRSITVMAATILSLGFIIKNMNAEFLFFKEVCATYQRTQEIALETQLLCSECQETRAISRELLARSFDLLSQSSRGAIATAMGAAGHGGRGVQPHAWECSAEHGAER